MEFYFPDNLPEQLAFVSALVVSGMGLLTMLFPAPLLRAGGFTTGQVTAEGFAGVRSTGGLSLGLGLSALALAQDFTYLMLGAALALSAAGRILSLFLDRGFTVRNVTVLLVQVVLAALPIGYILGYFAPS